MSPTLQTLPPRPEGPTHTPPRLPPSSPIDLNPYTPSVPCLHCRLVSSPRCSLLNLLDHRRDHKRRPKRKPPPWYMYMYTKPDVPIPGLPVRCSRCVRDGVEWCVLREMGEMDGKLREGVGLGVVRPGVLSGAVTGATLGAEAWMEVGKEGTPRGKGRVVGLCGENRKGVNGGENVGEVSVNGGDMDGNDEKRSSDSLVIRARRLRRRVDMSNESSDEDEDGSTGTASASGKPMKSKKYGKPTKSSKANSPLPQGNPASHDIANYDADNDRDNNTDLNSDDDHDSDLDDSDTKSNVSSKTSFSKRSIKSTKSTTSSPFLTPSSSPPVKHPESRPPPPPSPPEQISSDYVLKEERSWIWKEKWWDAALGKEKVKRRKKFNRDEWMGHPLFAAVTAVEVKKWDVIDLISNPSQKIQNGMETEQNAMDPMISTPGMMKRFFDSEIPFIAYVRTTGLEKGREEDLLEIVRSQILHVMANYEQNTETRKKEAISAAEGSLPLESRRFLLTTQEDLQRQFALPSWRRKGLEFLSADMVEMRRRKKVERIERERKMEEKRIHEKKLKELEMEQRARRKEQGEKGKDELKDQQQQQQPQQPSKESKVVLTTTTTTTSLTPSQNPIPSPNNSAPEPEPLTDPSYTSDDSDPEQPPSTPAEYFSRRLTRLHNFWTKEAQPADFEFAKAIKRNTFRRWRGETTSGNGDDENGREHENVTTTPKILNIAEWLARIAAQTAQRAQSQSQARAGGGRTRRRKLTRQQLADLDYSSDSFSSSSSEEEGGLCLADELEILTDASDDEDILRFLGDGDDDVGDDEREDKEEDMHEDEDSYPLVDHVRESMMNKR